MVAKKEISLLPDSENVNSLTSRILHWVATAGRYIIVFTELIVVLAFISRFWLDRKNADLSEVIRQQKAIIESTKDFQTLFTNTQNKFTFINSFYKQAPDYKSKIMSVVQSAPPDISFTSLSVSRNDQTKKIVASAITKAYLETSIVDFLTNLIVNPDISSLTISNIEKKAKDQNYNISFSLVFKDNSVSNASPSATKK